MSGTAYLIAGICFGALAGGALAWALTKARLSARAASLESSLAEVRGRIEEARAEAETLRRELGQARQAEAATGARLEEARTNLGRQQELLTEMKGELTERFKSISLDALSRNTEEFLKFAGETLEAQKRLGSEELSGKKKLIDQSIEGMTKKLIEVQKKIEDIGQGSMEKMGEVTVGIKHHMEATARLTETAEGLRRTLANTKKRGDWGERMAEDVIRLVGLVENINYIKQTTLDESNRRPDFTFLLPGDMKINMDVKFPHDNYMHYLSSETEDDRRRFGEQVVKDVRKMIEDVSRREYINKDTVDYVLVFIPNEQIYGFVNNADTELMDVALRKKVILCSPFTLYAVLAVIRQAMDNFNLERTASEILRLLQDFNKQWGNYKEQMDRMGARIDDARKQYETLVGTRTNMLERPLRKIEDLRTRHALPLDENLSID